MSALTVVPLVVAVVLAMVVGAAHRRLPPAPSARLLAVALGAVAIAAAPTLWVISLELALHLPLLGSGMRQGLDALGLNVPGPELHRTTPTWIALPILLLTVWGMVRLTKLVRRRRQLRTDVAAPIAVIESAEPFAVTLPGPGGQVLMSRGLVDLLDEEELAVVVAHEQAHATHRHDRFLLVEQVATAVVPLLRPLATRLRFELERWADEDPAHTCGDRSFVARTLGKVAMHTVEPAPGLGFGPLGTVGRVAALLGPPSADPRRVEVTAIRAAIVVTCLLAVVQLHHLKAVIQLLCPS